MSNQADGILQDAPIEQNKPGEKPNAPDAEISGSRGELGLASAGSPVRVDANPLRLRRFFIWFAAPLAVLAAAALDLYISARHRTGYEVAAVQKSAMPRHSPSPRAEQLYLQGRYEWGQRTEESLLKSVDAYTQAIVQDSDYAQAYAGLAESYDLLPEFGLVRRPDAFQRAEAAAGKAIELDPNLAAGHRARAFALFYGDWNAPASDAEFRRALTLAPDDVDTHHWYATTLFSRLEANLALTEIDRAVRLRPTSPSIVADAAFIHVFFGDDREANIHALRELCRSQPKLASPFRYLAEIDLEDGNYSAYLEDVRHAATISRDPDEVELAEKASSGWARSGKKGMLEGIRRAQEKAFAQGRSSGYWLARTELMLDEPGKALRYFDQAFARNDFTLMTLSACPCIAGLQNDPGYADLLRRVHTRMYRPAMGLGIATASFRSEAIPSIGTRPR